MFLLKVKLIMNIDERIAQYKFNRDKALSKLIKLRVNVVDKSEFGILASQIVDDLILIEKDRISYRTGAWSDEEKSILIASYKEYGNEGGCEEAGKKLNRTKQQIRAMAGNIGVRKYSS